QLRFTHARSRFGAPGWERERQVIPCPGRGSSAGRTRPRQQEDRAGAAVCRRLESDAPACLFEQRSRGREAEAAAIGPGGEAGGAETEHVVGRNARAGVTHAELNLVMGDAALQEEVPAIGPQRGERVVQDVEQGVTEREAV